MNILWERGERSVRQVLAALDQRLAYTTIATVLDRLHEKGLLLREKEGGSGGGGWVYRPARTREEVLAGEVCQILERSSSGVSEPFLLAFLDQVEQVDPDALDRLEALLQARRGAP